MVAVFLVSGLVLNFTGYHPILLAVCLLAYAVVVVVGVRTWMLSMAELETLRVREAEDEIRVHLISHLGDVIETFTRTRDVEAVLREAASALADHLDACAITLQVYERHEGRSVGIIEESGQRIALDDATHVEVVELGQTVLIQDLAAEGRYPDLVTEGCTALMAAPLGRGRRATDRAIGLVAAARRDRGFTAAEQELFTDFSLYVGLIVESAQLYHRTEALAQRDSLTDLYNKRRFTESLAHEVDRARAGDLQVALILLDVDDFKLYNDAHGHPAGDAALQKVAEILVGNTRADDVVARVGGEEFAVVLPATGREGARRVAETLRETTEATVFGGEGTEGHLTLSLGVAVFPDDAADPDALVAQADAALYRGKGSGRNRVRWAGDVE